MGKNDGVRQGEPVMHESEHYMQCPRCHREFDMRDLEQVIEHQTCYIQPKQEGLDESDN